MRPPVGAEPPIPRSRKPSVADVNPHLAAGPSAPTTFFLRSEDDLERSTADASTLQKDSTYGVQSLADTLCSSVGTKGGNDVGDKEAEQDLANTIGTKKMFSKSVSASPQTTAGESLHQTSSASSSGRASAMRNASPSSFHHPSQPALSLPLTPLRLESPMGVSTTPGSPKSISVQSFRLSDEESAMDDSVSQAILSSGEEDDDDKQEMENTSGSFPELVMPSIQMPRRRPFTAAGKNMGRLKVLIAGEAGVGKSSLIKSIVQLCDDIVHVDPLSPSIPDLANPSLSGKPDGRKKKAERSRTSKITEIYASTKAYPSWWSEMEDSRILRRRKSLNDTVLERNLCFIDTPGFPKNTASPDSFDSVVEYMESLLHRNVVVGAMNDSDLLNLLSGGGGVHVDVVLYLFSHQNQSRDVEYCRRLSSIANVIPLISKADTLSPSQITSLKSSILSAFDVSSGKPFLFGKSIYEAQLKLEANSEAETPMCDIEATRIWECIPPFAVSSKTSSDDDVMDASLLMSPDYVQPLVASDLSALVAQVFNPENISWLRHAASKKFIQWRNRNALLGDSMLLNNLVTNRSERVDSIFNQAAQDPISARTSSPASAASFLSSPSQVRSPYGTAMLFSRPGSSSQSVYVDIPPSTMQPSDYTLARLRDHTQAEERMAQVKLAKWAADLQRSLRNERERFEQLERNKRAQWLLERVSEEVKDGRIVPALPGGASPPSAEKEWAVIRRDTRVKNRGWTRAKKNMDPRDPLGLCELGDDLTRKGMLVLRVLGGVGVVGAVMVAVVRAFAADNEAVGWWEWVTGSGGSGR